MPNRSAHTSSQPHTCQVTVQCCATHAATSPAQTQPLSNMCCATHAATLSTPPPREHSPCQHRQGTQCQCHLRHCVLSIHIEGVGDSVKHAIVIAWWDGLAHRSSILVQPAEAARQPNELTRPGCILWGCGGQGGQGCGGRGEVILQACGCGCVSRRIGDVCAGGRRGGSQMGLSLAASAGMPVCPQARRDSNPTPSRQRACPAYQSTVGPAQKALTHSS